MRLYVNLGSATTSVDMDQIQKLFLYCRYPNFLKFYHDDFFIICRRTIITSRTKSMLNFVWLLSGSYLYVRDIWIVRGLVFYLVIIETIHTALIMYQVYEPLVIHFGKKSVFYDFPTTLPAESILMVLICTPIQIFIAWRIWRIQKIFWISILICGFSVMSAGGGIWTGIKLSELHTYANSPRAYPAVYLWLFSFAAADILMTGSLGIILSRRKIGLPASDKVIQNIIVCTIEAGITTSLAAIIDVILLLALPHFALNFIFDVMLVKIYAITLMCTLNARESLNKSWDNNQTFLFGEENAGGVVTNLGFPAHTDTLQLNEPL
ncbi:hypothetical protein GALMADRAFT_1143077 [Galerina marginata CBS 339.88]|uniref:DUF6534 domain-containing protein n=1 Tax=Galerina marginata (strain CBS 339.88) TaxID=685588 RepID=A0A067S6P9_GALM3|nr:hypothetical protein GALMADRAFT_1143077 [Galerina marginata CBS 339.88]